VWKAARSYAERKDGKDDIGKHADKEFTEVRALLQYAVRAAVPGMQSAGGADRSGDGAGAGVYTEPAVRAERDGTGGGREYGDVRIVGGGEEVVFS
jgi:hypothetical protein